MAASDWSEKTRMLVTVGVSLALNAGLGYFCFAANTTYTDLDKKLQAKRAQIKALTNEVDVQGPRLRLELAQKQHTLERKEKLLPNAENTGEWINKMAELAEKTGAQNKSIVQAGQAAGAVPGANYMRSVWHTRWTASFMSWCKLINSMEEDFERFVSFENLTITPKNNGMVPMGVQHEINVDVVVYTYIRK